MCNVEKRSRIGIPVYNTAESGSCVIVCLGARAYGREEKVGDVDLSEAAQGGDAHFENKSRNFYQDSYDSFVNP